MRETSVTLRCVQLESIVSVSSVNDRANDMYLSESEIDPCSAELGNLFTNKLYRVP